MEFAKLVHVGNTADDYNDLGSDPEVDKCCREHDHCDNIASGEEKNGLKNDDFFTRLHCECDKEFKQCLRKVTYSYEDICDICLKNWAQLENHLRPIDRFETWKFHWKLLF